MVNGVRFHSCMLLLATLCAVYPQGQPVWNNITKTELMEKGVRTTTGGRGAGECSLRISGGVHVCLQYHLGGKNQNFL